MPHEEDRQQRVLRLALLCLRRRKLTVKELVAINKLKEEVRLLLSDAADYVWVDVEKELWYHQRRKEFNQLTTQELETKLKAVRAAQRQFERIHDDEDSVGNNNNNPQLDELIKLPESHTTEGGTNPFLKGAGRAVNKELKGKAVMVEFPKTPPAVDLGKFGRL